MELGLGQAVVATKPRIPEGFWRLVWHWRAQRGGRKMLETGSGAGEMVTPRCPHCEAVGRGLVGPALLSHSLNPTLGEV